MGRIVAWIKRPARWWQPWRPQSGLVGGIVLAAGLWAPVIAPWFWLGFAVGVVTAIIVIVVLAALAIGLADEFERPF
jgi:hypothetical protein